MVVFGLWFSFFPSRYPQKLICLLCNILSDTLRCFVWKELVLFSFIFLYTSVLRWKILNVLCKEMCLYVLIFWPSYLLMLDATVSGIHNIAFNRSFTSSISISIIISSCSMTVKKIIKSNSPFTILIWLSVSHKCLY